MMSNLSVFIVLLYLCVLKADVDGQGIPTISYITRDQIKDIGGTVDLICQVQNAQNYPVLWIKYDRLKSQELLPISNGSTLIIPDSRFALRYNTVRSTYKLQIKDIQETDEGFYSCQITVSNSKATEVSAEVELQVRRQPVISNNSTKSIVVFEGDSVNLECYANGFPPPKIYWRRENNAILSTGGSIYRGHLLKIPRIGRNDRGTYYCIAKNNVGKAVRRIITVEVEFVPVIIIPKPRLDQVLGHDIDLTCSIIAYPPPVIIWLKNDIQIYNNQHYNISHLRATDDFTNTTLRVISIDKRHYGQYVCKATNRFGSAEATIELFETSLPKPHNGTSSTNSTDIDVNGNWNSTEQAYNGTTSQMSTGTDVLEILSSTKQPHNGRTNRTNIPESEASPRSSE